MTKVNTTIKDQFIASITKKSFRVVELNTFLRDNIDTLKIFGCNDNIYTWNDPRFNTQIRSLIATRVISKPTKISNSDKRVKLFTYRNIIEIMLANRYLSLTISRPHLKKHIIKLSNAEIIERLLSKVIIDAGGMINQTIAMQQRAGCKKSIKRTQVMKVKKTGINIIEPTPAPIETTTPANFVAIDTTQPLELQLKSLIEKIKMHGTTTTLIDLEYILASRKQMLANL